MAQRTFLVALTVMKKNGGQAIAVYNPDDPQRAGFKKCYLLAAHADRVKHIAPADYRPNTHFGCRWSRWWKKRLIVYCRTAPVMIETGMRAED